MKAEIVSFKAKDNTILDGLIYNYSDVKDTIIISTHGMIGNCFKEREKAIARIIQNTNIALLIYNNRGTGILTQMKKKDDNKESYFVGGFASENILDCYYDIKGAIEFALSHGYKKIFLQGHSLGSTKTVYTYYKLKNEKYEKLDCIKGLILLSLLDMPQGIVDVFKYSDEQIRDITNYAYKMKNDEKGDQLMPEGTFMQPITVDEFIRLCLNSDEYNYAKYHDVNYEYKELNNINIPLFMRWGNNGELISQNPKELVEMLNNKIKNHNKDFDFIDGANHCFNEYEDILAKQIIEFINKYNN